MRARATVINSALCVKLAVKFLAFGFWLSASGERARKAHFFVASASAENDRVLARLMYSIIVGKWWLEIWGAAEECSKNVGSAMEELQGCAEK